MSMTLLGAQAGAPASTADCPLAQRHLSNMPVTAAFLAAGERWNAERIASASIAVTAATL